jgi:hypothetical protein
MRFAVPIAILAMLGTGTNPTCASSMDDKNFDQQTIEALEAKVEQAQPRERCFLYADASILVHARWMRAFSVFVSACPRADFL